MAFEARDSTGDVLSRRLYYSVGGGFVVDEDEAGSNSREIDTVPVAYDFNSGDELLLLGNAHGLSFAELVMANECARMPRHEVEAGLDAVADAMASSIDRGCKQGGVLPGGLNVKRRAPDLAAELVARQETHLNDPLAVLDWINLWAMAVNEENAAGGRVVTAPHQRCRRHHSGGHALSRSLLPGHRRDTPDLPADGGRDRDALQEERFDFGRRSRLPGRGRRRLLDGGSGA